MRLAPFVGRRAGIEDPEITVDLPAAGYASDRRRRGRSRGTGGEVARADPPSLPRRGSCQSAGRPDRVRRFHAAPHALTSGPSLLPTTACTGAYADSSSSTLATQTSPACKITSAVRRCSATAGGQRFQNRGACVSERTTMRIDSSFQAHPGRMPWAWWASSSSRNSPCSMIAAPAPLARGSLRLHSTAPVTT